MKNLPKLVETSSISRILFKIYNKNTQSFDLLRIVNAEGPLSKRLFLGFRGRFDIVQMLEFTKCLTQNNSEMALFLLILQFL